MTRVVILLAWILGSLLEEPLLESGSGPLGSPQPLRVNAEVSEGRVLDLDYQIPSVILLAMCPLGT